MNAIDSLAPLGLQVMMLLGLLLLAVELVGARRRAVRRRRQARRRAYLLASGYPTHTHQRSHVTLVPPPADPPNR